MRWLGREMEKWGALGVSLFTLCIVALVAATYFGAPKAIDIATPNGPGIPPELADHQERAGLERGQAFGAEAATPLPTPETYLATLGIPYASYPSPNWSGRNGCSVQGIVVHVTGPGSMAGMRSWFKNPTSQVSAHFGIGKDGEIEQYVPLEDAAWQAGIINRPNTANPMINEWVTDGVNPNRCTIGIETLLGGPAEPLTDYPKMESSLVLLLRWLTQTLNIPADRVHIIGHNEIDSVNRYSDPPCCIDMTALVKEVVSPTATSGSAPTTGCTSFPCLTNTGLWRMADGRSWGASPAPWGTWYNEFGQPEWGVCDPTWNGRQNLRNGEWYHVGTSSYPKAGYWFDAPPCT